MYGKAANRRSFSDGVVFFGTPLCGVDHSLSPAMGNAATARQQKASIQRGRPCRMCGPEWGVGNSVGSLMPSLLPPPQAPPPPRGRHLQSNIKWGTCIKGAQLLAVFFAVMAASEASRRSPSPRPPFPSPPARPAIRVCALFAVARYWGRIP